MQTPTDPRMLPLQLGWHEIPAGVEVRCAGCKREVRAGEEVIGTFEGVYCVDCQRDRFGWPV